MAEICCDLVETKGRGSSPCGESNPRVARRRRMEFRRLRLVSGANTMALAVQDRKRARHGGLSSNSNSKQRLVKKDSPDTVLGDGSGTESGLSSDFESDSSFGKRLCGLKEVDYLSYGVTSVCGRRREMEDCVSIHMDVVKKYHFFGVFDGHGCSHVAALCKERMHEIVANEVKERVKVESNKTFQESEWRDAMNGGFAQMDREAIASGSKGERTPNCSCEMRTPRCDHVGSTAVVAIVGPTNIVVANCGDSRAVLCRNGSAFPLSSDHKPDRPDELQRIQQAGGKVIYWDGARVFGVLAMSRAIGDSYLKPYVISEPEVKIMERSSEDECMILASDGLWDVVSNEMACEIVSRCLRLRRSNNNGSGEMDEKKEMDRVCADAAMLLTKLALARHSSDNVSVVVVNLKSWDL